MAKLRDVHQAMLEAQLAKLEGMHVAQAIAGINVHRARGATSKVLPIRTRCSFFLLEWSRERYLSKTLDRSTHSSACRMMGMNAC